MRHRSVLHLGTGARHCGLAFGGPRHQVVAEKDTVVRGGASDVGAAGPIGVGVGGERGGRRGVKLKTEVEGATNVAEDPLDEVEMGLPRGVHVEARLLHGMSNLGTGERQVLKRAGKTPVLSSIGDECVGNMP